MTTLFDYASAVLTNIADVAAAQTPPIPLPDLRYVAPGPYLSVSFDCDQVVVAIDGVARGEPNEPVTGYVRIAPNSVTVTVAIIRLCMPTSKSENPPPAADQANAAALTMADLDLLWRNAKAILNAGGCTHSGVALTQLIEVQSAAGGARLTGSLDLLQF